MECRNREYCGERGTFAGGDPILELYPEGSEEEEAGVPEP